MTTRQKLPGPDGQLETAHVLQLAPVVPAGLLEGRLYFLVVVPRPSACQKTAERTRADP